MLTACDGYGSEYSFITFFWLLFSSVVNQSYEELLLKAQQSESPISTKQSNTYSLQLFSLLSELYLVCR